jgi:serine/threonine protein kinase
MSTVRPSVPKPQAEAVQRGPSRAVARALGRYKLDPTGLGTQAFEAWMTFLTAVAGAATNRGHEASAYADGLLAGPVQPLLDTLRDWPDGDAAEVFVALTERWKVMRRLHVYDLDLADVVHWAADHDEDGRSAAVVSCIAVTPPPEVRIERRLAMTGHQKRVFAAEWTASGQRRQIVLKEFLGDAAKVIPREMQAYPLSMMHPNIIQTYRLENPADSERPFLAERRIHPLNDEWRAEGLAEAAQVLTDLARALSFLVDQGLVHGDIKPDNIGYDDGRYLLLDFGVARPAGDFAALAAPTGTLRTQAPEVIRLDSPQTAIADAYALGATIFNTLYGQFPLIRPTDEIGEAHTPQRDEFVRDLTDRLRDGWEGDIHLLGQCPHNGLRELLLALLNPNPNERPPTDEVLRRALTALEPLIGTPEGPLFRPWDEIDQMALYLSPREEDMRLLPRRRATDLDDRLTVLEQGLGTETIEKLFDELIRGTRDILGRVSYKEAEREFRAVLDELERQKQSVHSGIYEELTEKLRGQLRHRDEPWQDIPPDGKRALEAPLRSALSSEASPQYRARLQALLEALERRQALPAW